MKLRGLKSALLSAVAAACILTGCSSSSELAASYAKAASLDYSFGTAAEPAAGLSAPSSAISAAESAASAPAESQTESRAESSSAVNLTGVMTATDGIGRISVPDGWSDLSGQIEDALGSFTLKAGCPDEAMYLMLETESTAGSPIPDLQAYFNTIVSGMTENEQLSDVNRQADEDITLSRSGYPAKVAKFTAVYKTDSASEDASAGVSGSDEPLAFWVYAINTGDYYCQFVCWTRAADAVGGGAVFDAIVNSFTLS